MAVEVPEVDGHEDQQVSDFLAGREGDAAPAPHTGPVCPQEARLPPLFVLHTQGEGNLPTPGTGAAGDAKSQVTGPGR